MSDAKDQHEPSMEEILASIRRIISEDGEAPQAGAGHAEDDVLVLTQEVGGDESGVTLAAPAPEPPPVLEVAPPEPAPFEPALSMAEPEPPPAQPAPPPTPPPAAPLSAPEFGRRIISDNTATASLAALSELVSRTHRGSDVDSLPMGQSNRTLEDLTRELLLPMLKTWLDANLPQVVERIVREEIGRLALDAQRR